MTGNELDIPPWLVPGSAEHAAAKVEGRNLRKAAAPAAAAATRQALPPDLDRLPTLSSARGRKARAIATLVGAGFDTRAKITERLETWHPAALASAIKLAEAHGLIVLERGVYRLGEP